MKLWTFTASALSLGAVTNASAALRAGGAITHGTHCLE